MDLRAKLARLRPEPPTGVDDRVAELRARMNDLVTRSRARVAEERATKAAAFEASAKVLPFEEEAGPSGGVVHVRTVRYARTARVGWAALSSATEVGGPALGILALDPALSSCDPRGALYLDTEATGLSFGAGTIAFLIGVAWFEDDTLVVEQLLLKRLGEEAPMLERLAARLRRASMVVTFNGKSFDLPLLRTRAVMNRLERLPEPAHLDLVHLARRIHRAQKGAPRADAETGPTIERWDDEGARRVSSCKLVALERTLLGFAREGDIDGGEVPARYAQFLRQGDADAILAVCEHNLWDVVSMAALVGVYGDALRAITDEGSGDASRLDGHALVGLARTLGRAGALELARKAADAAVLEAERHLEDASLEVSARHVRGSLRKKSRDAEGAAADYAHLSVAHDDRTARLELAKLLEHRLRAPAEALEVVARGTTEDAERTARRALRLSRKVARKGAQLTLARRR